MRGVVVELSAIVARALSDRGERSVQSLLLRRMVELARKDSTEKALVKSTVLQLIVSWAEW